MFVVQNNDLASSTNNRSTRGTNNFATIYTRRSIDYNSSTWIANNITRKSSTRWVVQSLFEWQTFDVMLYCRRRRKSCRRSRRSTTRRNPSRRWNSWWEFKQWFVAEMKNKIIESIFQIWHSKLPNFTLIAMLMQRIDFMVTVVR